MNPSLTVRVSDSAGVETVATKSFQVVSGETIFPINVPTNGTDATAALQAALNGLPNGTAENVTVGLLPTGTVTLISNLSPTIGIQMVSKQWVELRGQNTTLSWPDYGPSSNGLWQRRHMVLVGCTHVTLRKITVKGPHVVRASEDQTRAHYDPNKAFQHGWQMSSCNFINVFDCSVYEIAGDALYMNTVNDLVVDGLRVEFNGRQGLAGIDGKRWHLTDLNIVNSARGAIDWEPIGTIGGVLRWISEVEIENSYLRGPFGVIFHRCSEVWMHHNQIRGGVRLSDTDTSLRDRRTVTLTDNDFGVWSVVTKDWPIVHANGFKALTVADNMVVRNLANLDSRGSTLVRLTDPDLSGATITVKDNTATDIVSALGAYHLSPPINFDTLVANNFWDVGNNDLGHGVIEGEPAWLASRLG